MVTYSQADVNKCPSRKSFAEALVRSFTSPTTSIVQWCCWKEPHRHGINVHHHAAIKLNRTRRWLPSKKYLQENYGISVHYSSTHANYYTAWRYVTNQDQEYEESEGHPDLPDYSGPSTAAVRGGGSTFHLGVAKIRAPNARVI